MSQAELDRHEVARWAVDLRNEFEHDDTRAFFVMAHTASYAEFITGSSWSDLSTTFRDLLSKYGDRGANAWFERFLLNQPSWRDVYGSRWTGVSSDSPIVEHLLEYLDARSEAAVGESSVAAETSEYLTQQEVGQRIFELRTERGVSQRCLADAIGVDPSAMSRIESGQRGLAVSELVGISGFLGVPTESLLRRQLTAAPLFRNEGGDAEAADALAAFEAIIDDFFAFEAAART